MAEVPMETWIRKEFEEEYNESAVPSLACAGKRFVLLTKDDMVRFAGGDLGIHIFNAMKDKAHQGLLFSTACFSTTDLSLTASFLR